MKKNRFRSKQATVKGGSVHSLAEAAASAYQKHKTALIAYERAAGAATRAGELVVKAADEKRRAIAAFEEATKQRVE